MFKTKKTNMLLILSSLLLLNTNVFAIKSAPPGSSYSTKANILLLLDKSGSMVTTMPVGETITKPNVLAVSSSNTIVVSETLTNKVKIFKSDGTFIRDMVIPINTGCSVSGMDFDSSDNLWVSVSAFSNVNNCNKIYKFSGSTDTILTTLSVTDDSNADTPIKDSIISSIKSTKISDKNIISIVDNSKKKVHFYDISANKFLNSISTYETYDLNTEVTGGGSGSGVNIESSKVFEGNFNTELSNVSKSNLTINPVNNSDSTTTYFANFNNSSTYTITNNDSGLKKAIDKRTVVINFKPTTDIQTGKNKVIFEEGGSTRGLNVFLNYTDSTHYKLGFAGWNLDNTEGLWSTNSLQNTSNVVDGNWHQLILTYSGNPDGNINTNDGFIQLYLDGNKVSEKINNISDIHYHSDSSSIGYSNNSLTLTGFSINTTDSHFNGEISHYKVYEAVIGATDALNVFQNTKFTQTGTVIYTGDWLSNVAKYYAVSSSGWVNDTTSPLNKLKKHTSQGKVNNFYYNAIDKTINLGSQYSNKNLDFTIKYRLNDKTSSNNTSKWELESDKLYISYNGNYNYNTQINAQDTYDYQYLNSSVTAQNNGNLMLSVDQIVDDATNEYVELVSIEIKTQTSNGNLLIPDLYSNSQSIVTTTTENYGSVFTPYSISQDIVSNDSAIVLGTEDLKNFLYLKLSISGDIVSVDFDNDMFKNITSSLPTSYYSVGKKGLSVSKFIFKDGDIFIPFLEKTNNDPIKYRGFIYKLTGVFTNSFYATQLKTYGNYNYIGEMIYENNFLYTTNYYNQNTADEKAEYVLKFNGIPSSGSTPVLTFGATVDSTRIDIMREVWENLFAETEFIENTRFALISWSDYSYKTTYNNGRVVSSASNTSYLRQTFTSLTDNLNTNIIGYMNTGNMGGWTHADTAMFGAKTYFDEYFYVNPSDKNCTSNSIILISDGEFNNTYDDQNVIAKDLFDNYNIKTYALGFSDGVSGQAKYQALATAGGTNTPLYADNKEVLLSSLQHTLRDILEYYYTFTTPVIKSSLETDTSIYQTNFEVPKNGQWKGRIYKSLLREDGTVDPTPKWEAADLLNSDSSDNRKIWTVIDNSSFSNSDINNFKLDNLAIIKESIFSSITNTTIKNENTTNFIKWVRGIDVFDEDSDGIKDESRWKLQDIYHSEINVVSKPNSYYSSSNDYNEAKYRFDNHYSSFISAKTNRVGHLYAGSNGGLIHAFNDTTGKETWAFLPPYMLDKIKNDAIQFNSSDGSIDYTKIPLPFYGVDGDIIIKDIFYNNEWKTILMVNSNYGGKSFSILDVTDPNSPHHLFSLFNDTVNSKIKIWRGSDLSTIDYNSLNTDDVNDYSKLGDTTSQPIITLLPTGENKTLEWNAIMGAGFYDSSTNDISEYLYLISLDYDKFGEVNKKIKISEISGNGINNSAVSKLAILTSDSTSLLANVKGAMVYLLDKENSIYRINLTDEGNFGAKNQLFVGSATSVNKRESHGKLTPYLIENSSGVKELFLSFGTSNPLTIDEIDNDTQNRIYSIRDKSFPNYNNVSTIGSFSSKTNLFSNFDEDVLTVDATNSNSELESLITLNDSRLTEVNLNTTDATTGVTTQDTSTECKITDTNEGWYINLDKNEKITGDLLVIDNVIYATSYIPPVSDSQTCGMGQSYLFAVEAKCSTGQFANNVKKELIGNGISSTPTAYGNKIIVSKSIAKNDIDVANGESVTNSTINVINNVSKDKVKPIYLSKIKEVKE